MKSTLNCLALALLLTSCATTPPESPEQHLAGYPESCLVLSATMVESLRRQGVDAETLVYRRTDVTQPGSDSGHAVTVYMYPRGKNKLWTHDQLGSFRTRAYRGDAPGIARQAEMVRGRTWSRVTYAEFLDRIQDDAPTAK